MALGTNNLNNFFNPKTIAVIGASNREDSLGAKILRNLLESHNGSVFPVNPFRPTAQGIIAYPSISRVPSKIDLAIIATPAHTIPQIVEECGKAKVQNIIIVSAGLNECDEDGKELTQQILEHKKTYGMRIIGPNSLGLIRPKTNFYATFAEKKAPPGKIAFISQSAALCGSILDWSIETQVGLSGVVSTGSSIDVDLGELIDYFGADSQTRSIMLYVESIKNIRSFMSAARGFARTKPIIIVKAGRFTENLNPKLPYANQLANEDAIYDAAFRRVGVVRVETLNELFDCAKALTMQPNPNDNNLTIITNAAGPGLLAVDQLNARGGKLSQISNASTENLKRVLPQYCNISNPIDVLEEATPERFKKAIQICLNDPSISNLLIIYTPLGATNSSIMANMIIELSNQTRKKLLISLMGEDSTCQEARKSLHQNGIPAFKTPEEAIHTFMHMYAYTQNLKLLYQTPEELPLNMDSARQST
jgi:acetyltransferase